MAIENKLGPIRATCEDDQSNIRLDPFDESVGMSLHVRNDPRPRGAQDRVGFLAFTCPHCHNPHTKQYLGQHGLQLVLLLSEKTDLTPFRYGRATEVDALQPNIGPEINIEQELRALEDLEPGDFAD